MVFSPKIPLLTIQFSVFCKGKRFEMLLAIHETRLTKLKPLRRPVAYPSPLRAPPLPPLMPPGTAEHSRGQTFYFFICCETIEVLKFFGQNLRKINKNPENKLMKPNIRWTKIRKKVNETSAQMKKPMISY